MRHDSLMFLTFVVLFIVALGAGELLRRFFGDLWNDDEQD